MRITDTGTENGVEIVPQVAPDSSCVVTVQSDANEDDFEWSILQSLDGGTRYQAIKDGNGGSVFQGSTPKEFKACQGVRYLVVAVDMGSATEINIATN